MKYFIKQSNADIDDQLNKASAWDDAGGSGSPGSSYESGVKAGIEWVLGDRESAPIEEGPEEE